MKTASKQSRAASATLKGKRGNKNATQQKVELKRRKSNPKPAKEILLADYRPPEFLIDHVTLDVNICSDKAIVKSRLEIRRNAQSKKNKAPLVLQGEIQKAVEVALDGKRLVEGKDYRLTEHDLTIHTMPANAVLDIASEHTPYANTALSGFYASGPMLCTQCEAEGFRRITYYLDRPDVMAKFKVTLHADKKKYPVLLANGNLLGAGDEPKGRHFATWEDPFPKPCYLFAMVAGKLDKVKDQFTTRSGREVLIEMYVEPGKTDQTAFALDALKKAMAWDERTYGLEYDLDRFMIVATPYFNMGAMENKGLNIFNDSCVLGRADTATDATISFIERVVGHEYFHNWTGDRVTCRDWFQLSLKEGLTVFREQEFMGDMHDHAVERIENVRDLRSRQFAEDAGAMAHPVRPDRYQAIDNFYTATVYDKGSEVVRMIQTLAGGRVGFRKGMELYFKRHDGQAVTCDDFAQAMADANKLDIKQFMLWYAQAGTPTVNVKTAWSGKSNTLKITLRQSCPPTPGQPKKKPMHIPFAVGLLGQDGRDMMETKILDLHKSRQSFEFSGLKEKPVLSLLRDYSAPLRLDYDSEDEDLLFLLAHDSDPFNRWEAGQKLGEKYLLEIAANPNKRSKTISAALSEKTLEAYAKALEGVLVDDKLDGAYRAMALTLPSESELGLALVARGKKIDPEALSTARKSLVKYLSSALRESFEKVHDELSGIDPMAADGVTMGKRSLRNLCLSYLSAHHAPAMLQKAYEQCVKSKNMTDKIAALAILAETTSPLRDKALVGFEKQWKKMPTVMDKWLMVQASAKRKEALSDVKRLMKHPSFDLKNPNRVSALIGVFAGNIEGFHAANASGYRFIAEMIRRLDPINPNIAARLAKQFARWRDYHTPRSGAMRSELQRLARVKTLSANTSEIVTKSLKSR
ncbi:MAG: aminopeptidase N [Bdellovibrionales bacterium]